MPRILAQGAGLSEFNFPPKLPMQQKVELSEAGKAK